jgi:hypothetical protein
MPKKVLPSVEEFRKFCEALKSRGFRETMPGEFMRDFFRLRLEAPSPREGREVGYTFSANGLTWRRAPLVFQRRPVFYGLNLPCR